MTTGELLFGRNGAAGHAVFMPGESFRAHEHDSVTEIFVCVSGHLTVRVGDATKVIGAGETLVVPPRVIHKTSNPGIEPAEFFYIKTPPDTEDFVWHEPAEETP